ncbi:MAG: hypothetical protein ACRD38_06090 [Nitrososphaerales archaeon]
MSRSSRLARSDFQKLVSTYVAKLEDEELDISLLAEKIHADVKNLTAKQRKRFLNNVRWLVVESKVRLKGRLTFEVASRIFAAVVFWEYACNKYAMTMIVNDPSRKAAWNKLSEISGMNRDNILAIIRIFDHLH